MLLLVYWCYIPQVILLLRQKELNDGKGMRALEQLPDPVSKTTSRPYLSYRDRSQLSHRSNTFHSELVEDFVSGWQLHDLTTERLENCPSEKCYLSDHQTIAVWDTLAR